MQVFKVVLILLALIIVGSVEAEIIVESTAGGNTLESAWYLGQSFTTPSYGPWDHITINFFNTTGSPVANGDLFLLDEEYLGTPANLSNSTPGFIAESTNISDGQWVFDPNVTLSSNTQYFFYSTALWSPGSTTGNGDIYSGGIFYGSIAGAAFQSYSFSDINFRVKGTSVAEPSSLLLLGSGLAAGGLLRRKAIK